MKQVQFMGSSGRSNIGGAAKFRAMPLLMQSFPNFVNRAIPSHVAPWGCPLGVLLGAALLGMRIGQSVLLD